MCLSNGAFPQHLFSHSVESHVTSLEIVQQSGCRVFPRLNRKLTANYLGKYYIDTGHVPTLYRVTPVAGNKGC